MRNGLLLTLALLSLSVFYTTSYCQDTVSFNQRNIIIYDNNVLVPRPNGADSLSKIPAWNNMFFLSTTVSKALLNDPTIDSIIITNAGFFTNSDTTNNSQVADPSFAILAPAGALDVTFQYLIEGTVAGSNGSYTLTLNLEAAQSREIAKQVTVNFGDNFDPMLVGGSAVSGMGGVFNSIMSFENQKCNSGDPYAIGPVVEATADKTILNTGESTNVHFYLTDYLGKPLKNRALTLTATLGSFSPTTVTTDANGSAVSKYTAGSTIGVASLNGVYYYKAPYDPNTVCSSNDGTAFVRIETSADWQLSGAYEFRSSSSYDVPVSQNYQHSDQKDDYQISSFRAQLGKVTKTPDNGLDVLKSMGLTFSGRYTSSSGYQYITQGDNFYMQNASHQLCYGPPHNNYNKNSINGVINASIGFEMQVYSSMRGAGEEDDFAVYGGNVTQSSQILTCGSEELIDFIFPTSTIGTDTVITSHSFVDQGDGYTVTTDSSVVIQLKRKAPGSYSLYYRQNYIKTSTTGGVAVTVDKLYERFSASLDSNTTTAVQNESSIAPKNYLLPNHPNPFNPETIIQYSIAKPGSVKLIIYDLLGREVKTLVDAFQKAGSYSTNFKADDLASGIYFYVLKTEDYSAAKKMLLLK